MVTPVLPLLNGPKAGTHGSLRGRLSAIPLRQFRSRAIPEQATRSPSENPQDVLQSVGTGVEASSKVVADSARPLPYAIR